MQKFIHDDWVMFLDENEAAFKSLITESLKQPKGAALSETVVVIKHDSM